MSNRKELLLPIMKSRIIKETDELPLSLYGRLYQGQRFYEEYAEWESYPKRG